MSLRITFFPGLIAAIVFGACDKGSEPVVEPKEALVSTPWLTSAHRVSPGVKSKPTDKPITEYVLATYDCHPSPEITFQANGRFAYSDGATRCEGSDLGKNEDTGVWGLSEDGETLALQMDKHMIPVIWNVKAISAQSLTVEFPMDGTVGDGTPQTEILTLRPK